MKKWIRIVWGACCLAVFCIPAADAIQTMTPPGWVQGQNWVVAVSYPSPLKKGGWSDPVRWRYRVTENPGTTPVSVFILEISRADTENTPVAVIRLAGETLAPISMETLVRRQGKSVSRTEEFEELRPLITEGVMAPVDLPIFPLTEGDTAGYTVSRTVAGDLVRKRKIIVRAATTESLPSESGLSGAFDYFKVTAAYDDGTPIFSQYWKEGAPWPSYGENDSMRYWLVDDEN